jgi:hypothetical protein
MSKSGLGDSSNHAQNLPDAQTMYHNVPSAIAATSIATTKINNDNLNQDDSSTNSGSNLQVVLPDMNNMGRDLEYQHIM